MEMSDVWPKSKAIALVFVVLRFILLICIHVVVVEED